jgi:putative transcriptional regulator
MTIVHHPHDATLAAFAGYGLDPGQRFVVSVHVSKCAQCRGFVRALTQMAGAWLDDIVPVPMSCEALAQSEARLEIPLTAEAPQPPGPQSSESDTFYGQPVGPWRWLGVGVRSRAINLPTNEGSRVFLLEAQPATRLPHHKHVGTEWTCTLRGAFTYDRSRFAAGDFDEADDTVEHVPVVEAGEVCLCLVAMDGHIELQGALGRLLQRFIRF